ncbi:retinol dehydrogenase 14 [Penicillium capsulatum]|uniref:Retinol dehydrogenase 14 n=1 Tax=Penicillium capsulatum TaxID=69766 RepID=A0A9W9I133_9EURO|nr:retinol dehydrogenase 14 [Penicillium capsulatum]KAJ6116743.1 retinol dehydrogenase 14 [Penicillium capsulatum]
MSSSLFLSRGRNFNPESKIPPLDDKHILVTGGTSGLGKQIIVELIKHHPAHIWLAARDIDKAKAVAAEIQRLTNNTGAISILLLDLASLETVRTAAEKVRAESSRLDLVILSAGVVAPDAAQTTDGYELNFGTNYLGPALLIQELLPLLRATQREVPHADVRVVSLNSTVHRLAPPGGIRFDILQSSSKSLTTVLRYAQSKLATALHTRALARHYPDLKFVTVHPGIAETPLIGHFVSLLSLNPGLVQGTRAWWMHDVQEGIKGPLWAAFSSDVYSGEYYEPVGVRGRASHAALDDHLERKLWDWTEAELKRWKEKKCC